MDNINYFETVAVPVLQQKCQELFSRSLVLETNLHIEANKAQKLQEELLKAQQAIKQQQADVEAARNGAAKSHDRVRELETMYEQLYADNQALKAQLNPAVKESNDSMKSPAAPVVRTLKGKVSKGGPAPIPVFTEPDDF